MKRHVLSVALAAFAIVVPRVSGANCALRNPDRQIFEMFPQATSYRSVVGNVESAIRTEIEAQVGGPITFNDMGKHTLYVVLNRREPIGFIHARSEIGSRGSVELVWALDLDLAIKGFRVQRSRERQTAVVKSAGFRELLIGKGVSELREYLHNAELAANLRALGIPVQAAGLVDTVIHSGVKTLAITAVAFRKTLSSAGVSVTN